MQPKIRMLLAAAALLVCPAAACAQSLSDILRIFSGSSSSASESAPAQSMAPSAARLCSVWSYSEPASKYDGDDMLASIAVGSMESFLPSVYAKAGLEKGRASVRFVPDGTFIVESGGRSFSGSYSYLPATGGLTVSAVAGTSSVTLRGTAAIDGGALVLLFDAGQAAEAIERVSPSAAGNENFRTVKSLLDKYPGIKLGCRLVETQ